MIRNVKTFSRTSNLANHGAKQELKTIKLCPSRYGLRGKHAIVYFGALRES